MHMTHLSTFQEIDGRITVLESELLALRRQRNSLTQIVRLPSEILVAIIEHIQHDEHGPNHRFPCQTYDKSWVRIMLVCKLFHTIALQTPTFWNILDHRNHSQRWINISASRSGGVPLYVRYRKGDQVDEQWTQVQSAELYERELVTAALGMPAPALRALSIYADNDNSTLIVSDHLLMNVSVRLTCLKLEGSAVILEGAPPMPCLRRLEIKSIRTDINFNALCQLLAQSPNIEVLLIRYLYLMPSLRAVDANQVMAVPERISLPQLQELFVEDTPAEVGAVLRILPAPIAALGALTTHLYNFSDVETALNDNHSSVYNSWLAFSRTVSGPMEGSIRFDHGAYSPHPLTAAIIFGTVTSVEDFTRPANFCSIVCQVTDSDPMLSGVTTLILRGDQERGVPHEDLDGAYGIRFLPALHTLILENLSESDREHMKDIQEWVIGRQGLIKSVQFVGCDDEIVQLAEEWRGVGIPVKYE
jgi:hypothetical protein